MKPHQDHCWFALIKGNKNQLYDKNPFFEKKKIQQYEFKHTFVSFY